MEVKDILAYLRVLDNPADEISLKRIINVPARGIGNATIDKISLQATRDGIALYAALQEAAGSGVLAAGPRGRVAAFAAMIERFSKTRASFCLPELARMVMEESGYLTRLKGSRDEEDAERLENLEQLLTAMEEFCEKNPDAGLSEFLEQVSLVSDLEQGEQGKPSVTLMTLHAAKGLEFKAVFMIGMEERLFPHVRALDDLDGMEEERRLCYVGMTRARERLYLLNALATCSARTRPTRRPAFSRIYQGNCWMRRETAGGAGTGLNGRPDRHRRSGRDRPKATTWPRLWNSAIQARSRSSRNRRRSMAMSLWA
jgi:DNA helicase-2/ATP-dependent DNA helicase PcrA